MPLQAAHLEVFSCAGRDIRPDEIPSISSTLLAWQCNAASVMEEVSTQLTSFKAQQEDARKAQTELDEKVAAVKATLRETQASGDGFGATELVGMRDLDDEKMRKSGRGMKARHAGKVAERARMQ